MNFIISNGTTYQAGSNPWSGTPTSIPPPWNFTVPGVPIASQALNALFQQTTAYSLYAPTVTALRAIVPPALGGAMCQMPSASTIFDSATTAQLFYYDPLCTLPDDGQYTIAPTGFATGRWRCQRGPLTDLVDNVSQNNASITLNSGTTSGFVVPISSTYVGQVGDIVDLEAVLSISGTGTGTLQYAQNGSPVGTDYVVSSPSTVTVKYRHIVIAPDLPSGNYWSVGGVWASGSLIFTIAYQRTWIRRP